MPSIAYSQNTTRFLAVHGDGEDSYGWSALFFLVFFFVSCKLWNVAFLLLLSIPMVLVVILCLLVFDVGGL
jgi:hypothetical protein